MIKVEKVHNGNRQRVIDCLSRNIIANVFAFYDLQHEPENTTMYAALDDMSLEGYVLIYTALEFPSVVLECPYKMAGRLIDYTPEKSFIMHAQPNLLPIVKRKFPTAKIYVEKWMLVRRGQANFFDSRCVRRLNSKKDAEKLATLLSDKEDRPVTPLKKYTKMIRKQSTYGIFIDHKLISYASSFIQLPKIWMIGGVYTYPTHRNKGYATLATSAVTKKSLENAEAAALFVRTDNHPAVKAYEKIGYKRIADRLWIDVGVGMKP